MHTQAKNVECVDFGGEVTLSALDSVFDIWLQDNKNIRLDN